MLHHQENALIGALSHSRILFTALIRLLKKAQQQGIWLAQKSVKSRGVKFNKFLRAAQIELSAIILFYVSLCTHWSFGFQNFASFLPYETCLVDLYKKEVFINIDCARESNMGNWRSRRSRSWHWFSRVNNFPCYPLKLSIIIIFWLIVYITFGSKIIQVKKIFVFVFRIPYIQTLIRRQSESVVNRTRINSA